jgi:tyrosyl-tRNA synthetase
MLAGLKNPNAKKEEKPAQNQGEKEEEEAKKEEKMNQAIAVKMSKSDPMSAIFMEDEEADVKMKITSAYCPPGVVKGNPCLEYCRYIIYEWFPSMEIVRQEKHGGNK